MRRLLYTRHDQLETRNRAAGETKSLRERKVIRWAGPKDRTVGEDTGRERTVDTGLNDGRPTR